MVNNESLRARFEEQERLNRQQFENFVQKRKDNHFVSNLLIFKMRAYHYKELLKVFLINFKAKEFESSRNSVYLFLAAPSIVALGFNIVSPFSMLRSVGVYGAFCSACTCFFMSLRDEMHTLAQEDPDKLGFEIRYRYSQLAAYDKLQHSYKAEIKKFDADKEL